MAAIPIPYTFVTGTIIDPDQMNANFQAIAVNAVSDVGGVLDAPTLNNATVTGDLLFSPDAVSDIGKSGASRPRDLFLARNGVVGGTLTVAGALTVAGTVYSNRAPIAAPFTLPSWSIYDDGLHWAHLVYGADTSLRFTFGKTGAAGPLQIGTSSASNNTGSFTQAAVLAGNGDLTLTGGLVANGPCAITASANPILALSAVGMGFLTVRGNTSTDQVYVGSPQALFGLGTPQDGGMASPAHLYLGSQNAAGSLRFVTANVERMRLHPSGGLSLGNVVDPGAGGLRVTGSALISQNLQVSSGLTAGSVYASAGIQADGLFYGSGESNPNLFSSGAVGGGGTRTLGGAPDSAAPTAWLMVRYNGTTFSIPVWV